MQRKSQKMSNLKDMLEENEVFYRHLVELTPDAIVIHSEGKVVFINPIALKLIGAKDAKEVVGRSVMDFIHPDSIPLIQERIKKLLAKQKIAPYVEEKFITLKEEIIIAETKAVPFIYHGKPAILAILHDITKRKKNEERQAYLTKVSKLLSSSIEYKTTLENISKSIVPTIADYIRIVLIDENKSVSEIFTYHKNLKKLEYAKELYQAYKNRSEVAYGIRHLLSSGKPEIIEKVTPQIATRYKKSIYLQELMATLGLTSYMGVHLKIQGKIIGALTFSSIQKERMYTKEDLLFAEEIGQRIAYAIENARLYSQAQKSLEAEERLAAIVSFSDDAIISKTPEGIITSWNNAAERMFGYTTKEAIGKSIFILIPKNLWGEERKIIKRIKKGLHIEHYETVRLRKDGKPISVSVSISAIKNSKGEIIGASNITRNITEKKKVENELAHLASLVESSSDAIWSGTLEGEIISWNKGAEKMFGFAKDEVIGQKIRDIVIPHNKKKEMAVTIEKIRQGKQIQSLETERLTKDGRKIDVSITISPLKDAQGEIIGISAIGRNITEQKEQEKLKDEFISMASHELKTPITSLKMFLDILERSLSETSHKEVVTYVSRIKDQANKIKDLVNDLLDISRIGAGKLHFTIEKFRLEELIKDTIEGIQPAAKKHTLLFAPSASLEVAGDRFRIYQVITNLINNAIKYSPNSNKVFITVEEIEGKAIVSVQDFGIGIAKDKQKKIFDKLYQVTDPQVKTFPGLGMGLYISNEIIKRHKGEMWVKSEKGKGSIFFFSLPL